MFFLIAAWQEPRSAAQLPAQAAAAPTSPGAQPRRDAGWHRQHSLQPLTHLTPKGPHTAQWEPRSTSSSPCTAWCPARRWQTSLLQSPPQAEHWVLPEGSTASATAAPVLVVTSMSGPNTLVAVAGAPAILLVQGCSCVPRSPYLCHAGLVQEGNVGLGTTHSPQPQAWPRHTGCSTRLAAGPGACHWGV